MDPILRIIQYIFTKHGKINTDKTIDSFFDNGTSFPQLVEIFLNCTLPLEKGKKNADKNNKDALKYLLARNKNIKKYFDSHSEVSRANLLLEIAKNSFNTSITNILNRLNSTVKDLNIQFTNMNDIQTGKCILCLLNVLTKNKVEIVETNPQNFDQIMIQSFQIANVPLVIDKSSLKLNNHIVFIIQLLIIFDCFKSDNQVEERSVKIENKTEPNPQNSVVQKKEKYRPKREQVLTIAAYKKSAEIAFILNSINAIIKANNNKKRMKKIPQINSLDEAAEVSTISDILQIFFPIFKKFQNIDDVLNFLSKKQPIFSVLLFDFKNIMSIKLFYTKLFDIYFLKQSKKRMLERIKIILFTTVSANDTLYSLYKELKKCKDVKKNEQNILCNINTYYALIYFCKTGKIHFQKDNIEDEKEYNFKNCSIPQILNEYSFNDKTNLSPMYYQVQFIFNAIDEKGPKCTFTETILKKLRKVRKVKVPEIETISANIISRNIALIQQSRNLKELEKNQKNSDENIPLKKDEIEEEEEEIEEVEEIEEIEESEFKDDSIKEEEKIITFKSRCEPQKYDLITSMKQHYRSKKIPPEVFWNPSIDDTYKIDDGCLFRLVNTNPQKDLSTFDQAINYYASEGAKIDKPSGMQNVFRLPADIRKQQQKDTEIVPTKQIEGKLNKLFYYDERQQKWEFDPTFEESKNSIKFNLTNSKTTLVLFSNSFEKDLIKLNSNLINYLYPNFNDKGDKTDQIFVYALCGPPLLITGNTIDKNALLKNAKELTPDLMKKPLYLLLHIPESKKNLTNLNIIIYQIYFYLSFICDIEVSVLNRSYYRGQIGVIKDMRLIKKAYKESSIKRQEMLKLSSENFQLIRPTESEEYESDDEINFLSDNDENDDIIDFTENEDVFSKIEYQMYQRERKYIMLINNDKLKDSEERSAGPLLTFIKGQIIILDDKNESEKICHAHYINVDDKNTYKKFYSSLFEFSLSSDTTVDDAFKRFNLLEMTQITSIYIMMRNSQNKYWKDKLKKLINERFGLMKPYDTVKRQDDFELIYNLSSEVYQIYPSIDDEFGNECKSDLSEITMELARSNGDQFKLELEKSSQSSIDYWSKIIKKQDYWPANLKENIINNHINFLKNEFFDIINGICPKRELLHIFKVNSNILDSQKTRDISKFIELFTEVENEFAIQREKNQKIIDMAQQKESGTNYMIRERENVREIKATIEVGQLDATIEPDF